MNRFEEWRVYRGLRKRREWQPVDVMWVYPLLIVVVVAGVLLYQELW